MLNCALLLVGEISEEGEQHASSERRNAVAQSLLTSIPVRLASGRADEPTGRGRATGRRERKDDGPRAAPR